MLIYVPCLLATLYIPTYITRYHRPEVPLSTVSKLYPMSADVCNLDNQVGNYTYIFSVCIKTTSKKGVFNFRIAIGTILI